MRVRGVMRTAIVLVTVLLTAGLATIAGDSGRPGYTSADLSKLKSVADVDVSPDGARVAYILETREKSGAPSATLWVFDVAAGTHTQVGDNRLAASTPRWSPDGHWLAFLGRGDGRPGLMLSRVDDVISDPELLVPVTVTNHPLPHAGAPFAWSSGSSRLAYVSAMPGPEGDLSGDPAVITRYAYKPATGDASSRFNDNRRLQLFMVDLVSRRPQQLTDEPVHHHSVHWARTGDDILYASNQEADPDRVFNDDIFAFNIVKRTSRRITKTPQAEYDPAASPDGKLVAVRATTRSRTSSETSMEDTHVWVMKADGTARVDAGATIDNRQGAPRWSTDGKSLVFAVDERGDTRLYRVAPAGGPAEPLAPSPGERGRVTAWSMATNGLLAYAMVTPDGPAELFVQTPGAHARRVTALNDELRDSRQAAAVERFTFKGDGGLDVEAFLTRPPAASATAKVPLIVIIHGGPHAQQGPEFNLRAQAYATKGWASLLINYRGSTGYGQRFADAIQGDQNGAEARDILAGVDAAIAGHDWLDGTKLGIEGASYGGQLTNWLITQTTRFAAAVSQAGISNLVSFAYTAYYHDYLPVEFGALPHEGTLMDTLFQRSPLRHVAAVKTPVLLIHGELDNDVPIGESEQFYIALRDAGVPTVFVRYPREGHGLREVRHQADAIDRSIQWYARAFDHR
jgi:dipeptidyl aminopeptidase/acylaminoacyl peptidase